MTACGALVTGAGSGIGRACAVRLSRMGYAVALLGREAAKLEALEEECRDALALPADVTDPAQVVRAVDAAVANFGRLDVVVVNAGVFPPRRRVDHTAAEDWGRTLGVNLDGAYHTVKAVLPHLRNTGGYLFGVASVYARGGLRFGAPYAASKAGMVALLDTVNQEHEEHGVRATVISPGVVRTAMAGQRRRDLELLEPDDIAKTLAYCLDLSRAALVRTVEVERAAVSRNDREVQEDIPAWLVRLRA